MVREGNVPVELESLKPSDWNKAKAQKHSPDHTIALAYSAAKGREDDNLPGELLCNSCVAAVTAMSAPNDLVSWRRPGTAFRIGPRHWLTAAHTILDYSNVFKATKVDIWPGYTLRKPRVAKRRVRAIPHPKWLGMHDVRFDLAILIEPKELKTVGPASEWLRLEGSSQDKFTNHTVLIPGYETNGVKHTAFLPVSTPLMSSDTGVLRYNSVTQPGYSGAPVIIGFAGNGAKANLRVIGVHSRGPKDHVSKWNLATGVRLDEDHLNWIKKEISRSS